MSTLRRVYPVRVKTSGFTLVELQIAVLIMTMIAVLMATGLRATLHAWDRSTAHQDQAEHEFLLDQFLRRHLNNMRFIRARLAQRGPIISFIGNSTSLHFVAPYPSYENDGTLYWWTLKSEPRDSGSTSVLVLEYLPFDTEEEFEFDSDRGIRRDDKEISQLTIASNLRLDNVQYFSENSTGSDRWLDIWLPGSYAPRVIKLQLSELDASGQSVANRQIAISPQFYNQKLQFNSDDF